MHITRFLLIAMPILAATLSAQATTWATRTVTDPIGGGECEVSTPASWGSYIYQWPSKYDGVYWPHTTNSWIWYCPESGYASFGNDFESLTGEEIEAVRTFLETGPDRSDLFAHLEAVYRVRDMDTAFWAWFQRLKAARHQEMADRARRDAMPLMEEALEQLEPGFERIKLLFVLGDYHRRFGEHAEATDLFDQARHVAWEDEEGSRMVGHPYFDELIDQRLTMIPEAAADP